MRGGEKCRLVAGEAARRLMDARVPRISLADQGGDHFGAGFVGGPHQRPQPASGTDHIIVDKDHEFGGGRRRAQIARFVRRDKPVQMQDAKTLGG